MWGRKRAREKRELNNHRELVNIGEQQMHLSRSGLRWQITAAAIALLTAVISLFAWHPWAGAGSPQLHARVKLALGSHDAYVPARPQTIPPPPPYSLSSKESRCEEWWRSWFEQQKAAEVNSPILEVSAPASAAVSVVGARVHIFESYAPSAITKVQCASGYGPEQGTLLYFNMRQPDARPKIVASDGRETPLTMPTAVINVDPGVTEEIALTARGPELMYEWGATIRVVIDQHEETFEVGTPRRPSRSWLGEKPRIFYAFDEGTSTWTPE